MDGELNYYQRLITGVYSIPGSAESVNVSRVFFALTPGKLGFEDVRR
jgi:hypothetical protein